MDVSGWTVDQRMRFPDWCFPQKQVISAYRANDVALSTNFAISEIAIPDPVCLWEVGLLLMVEDPGLCRLRFGMRATIPVNEAQMDAAEEILPYMGQASTGPNYITGGPGTNVSIIIPVRKVLESGGLFLVMSNYLFFGKSRLMAWLLVSGLPTSMAGWLAHNK